MVYPSTATIGFEGGAANESERFACGHQTADRWKAKDDVDNVGAGRAAKGANPIGYTKKPTPSRGWVFGISQYGNDWIRGLEPRTRVSALPTGYE